MNNLTKLHFYKLENITSFNLGEFLFAGHVNSLLEVGQNGKRQYVSFKSFSYYRGHEKYITFIYE